MEFTDLLIAAFGIAVGGFLKGATGAGTPVVGVPILALIFDVPTAVAIFSVLNLFSNLWQMWSYRAESGSPRLVWGFAISGGLGAAAGSVLLANLHTDVLMGTLAVVVFCYIALRLARPHWKLARDRGERLAPLVGAVGGVMQGAGGISAPVSITYLNAMGLGRGEFIATISVFFMAMSVLQIPSLAALGVLDWDRTLMAVAGAVPMFAAMPLGEWSARRVSKETFDRLILLLLTAIALKLLWSAVF